MLRRPWASLFSLLGAVALLSLADGGAAAAVLPEAPVSSLSRPSKVAAYAGHTAWSEWDGRARRYRLVVRAPDGALTRPAIVGRSAPFDVALGPDRSGRPTAVYSRCRRVPGPDPNFTDLPEWWEGDGCRIHRLTIGSRRERRVRTFSSGSSYLPSIWRGEIAFAWRRDRRPRSVGRVHVLNLGTGRSRPVGGGPAPDLGAVTHPGPTWIHLQAGRVLFGWSYYREVCPSPVEPEDIGNGLVTEVRHAERGSRRSTRVTAACQDDEPSVAVPAGFRGGAVVYALSDWRSGPSFSTVLYAVRPGAGPAARLGEVGTSDRFKHVDFVLDGERVVIARREITPEESEDAVVVATLAGS